VKLYVGTFGAVGKFDATLGGTTLKYSDSSLTNSSNGPGGLYTLTCAADSPGQTLTVKFVVERTLDPAGNVTLQAAALTAPGANNPPTISIGDPVGGADFSAHDNITIVADAADADGTIMKVEFFQNGARLGESSSSPYSLTWSNVPAGNFVLTANATDNGGATATSAPVEISVSGGGGTLSGSFALPPATVDLTAEGTSDWAHWGRASANSFDHKTGVPQLISNFTEIGTNDVQRYSDNYTAFSWTDGTPTASNNGTTTGVFIHGMTNGFSITAPADATVRTLKVYVGLNAAQGNFQAYLSDFSAPAYTAASPGSIFGNAYAVYTLNYAAASAGQTLIINYAAKTLYDANFGNVTLQAASLSDGGVPTNAPPTVVIANPTNNAAFTAPANMTITADASDSDGSISRVEFFDAADKLGETTNSPYSLAWSNVAAGTYTLTAKATDNLGATATSAPVTVSITNATALPVAIVDSAINGGQFQCRFQTRNGDSYTVEFTDSLNPVQWQTLTNLTGNGSIADVTDITLIGGERYYRVSAP